MYLLQPNYNSDIMVFFTGLGCIGIQVCKEANPKKIRGFGIQHLIQKHSGFQSELRLRFVSKNGKYICKTNELDHSMYNDYMDGAKEEYCGKRFLGECMGKDIGPDSMVTGDINPSWWQLGFGTERHLCIRSVTFTSEKTQKPIEVPLQQEGKRGKWNQCFCYFHSANNDWFEGI